MILVNVYRFYLQNIFKIENPSTGLKFGFAREQGFYKLIRSERFSPEIPSDVIISILLFEIVIFYRKLIEFFRVILCGVSLQKFHTFLQ